MTVYKMVEVVGTSNTALSDAILAAVHRAGETLDDIGWFEVKEIRGRVDGNDIAEYQVKVALGFRLHAAKEEDVRPEAVKQREGMTRAARSREAQAITAAARRGGNAQAATRGGTPTTRGPGTTGRGTTRGSPRGERKTRRKGAK